MPISLRGQYRKDKPTFNPDGTVERFVRVDIDANVNIADLRKCTVVNLFCSEAELKEGMESLKMTAKALGFSGNFTEPKATKNKQVFVQAYRTERFDAKPSAISAILAKVAG